jgi:metal-responsive CopG/Arc/MetJ family transcriptional regulator
MPKRIISLTLSKETVQEVDKKSKALGMTRSEFVELMLNKGFHFSKAEESVITKISEMQNEMRDQLKKRGSGEYENTK